MMKKDSLSGPPEKSDETACIFDTAWGPAAAVANNRAVVRFFLPGQAPDDFQPTPNQSGLLGDVEREVNEYLAGRRREFSVPLEPSGTDFMLKVWRQLLQIPFGDLKTYGDVAKAVDSPGASRAVGMACGHNPIPLLIPCHRVVGAGNRLTGFSGGGVSVKRRLIEHEMGGLFAIKRRI